MSEAGRPAAVNAALAPVAEAQWQAQRRQRRRQRARARRAGNPDGTEQPTPVSPSQQAGGAAEARAWQYLRAQGCELVARNQRCRLGEIDLIVWDGASLVFVEVRWRRRRHARYGGALASVDVAKQQRLWRAAQVFLARQWPTPAPRPPCRFDIVAMEGDTVRWVRAAFAVPPSVR